MGLSKVRIRSFVCLILFCIGMCSCQTGKYGVRIEEDLVNTNVIEDNYRNYYEIFVRSFYDSNGDGIGDLQGIIEKLDYIDDLGFNGIWLMPIHPSDSYHKYDVNDYFAVDPSYGTMDDLEELIEECHKRNIRIILDLVLNHTGINHPSFNKSASIHQKYLNGQSLTEEEERWHDYYSFYDTKEDIPGNVGYQKVAGRDFYYECNFSSSMPELNLDNSLVQEDIQKIIDFYLDKGIDGFRLDAVKYYYMGSTAKNVEFLAKLNSWAKQKNPDAYIVGECWDSAQVIEEYYQSGCDSFFNFPGSISSPNGFIMNSINRDGAALGSYFDGMLANIEMASNCIPAPFIDNHDTPRFTSAGDVRKTKFQYALLQMLNGTTFTYYGDEVGLFGTNAGSANKDENVRIPIRWGKDGTGDCSMLSGITGSQYPYPTVAEQMEDRASIYHFYKKVLLIRNQNPEIARGSVSLIEMEKETKKELFIAKEYGGKRIGIIFNFSPTEDLNVAYQTESFTQVVGQIVVDQDKYIGMQKDNSILLPPYSIAIVK